jgi:LuxR family transcriptional regulator, maltose regulon positive regulatory protein
VSTVRRKGSTTNRTGNPVVASAYAGSRSRLLRSKLRAPATPEHHVRRARVHQLLDELVQAPLTLVVAPAGSGKTTLLSAWAAELAVPCCWLTVDERDGDPAQLWLGIMGALESVVPGCSERAGQLVRHREDILAWVDQLVTDLTSLLAATTVLVIDDLHLVDDGETVIGSLNYFLKELPASLHVVLASRRTPMLPLDRLRAQGHLREVHFSELRFSPAESAEMLTQLAPSMPEDQVTAICALAGGWAAGLQLAALAARAARATEEPQLPSVGADMLIQDYVWNEVLARENADLVTVLQDISVVERVDRALGLALSGRPDVGDLLLEAEGRGLFVNRLGTDGWFEVHALVRNALLGRLATTSPEKLRLQHSVAAECYEAADEAILAIYHRQRAGDWRDVLRLLASNHRDIYETGRGATLRRTLDALPIEIATADLEALIEYAWCHLYVDRHRFRELIDQITWSVERWGADETHRSRVGVLQSIAATIGGEWAKGGELARQALEAMGPSWWRDPFGLFGWNMLARHIALVEAWDDNADDIRQAQLALVRDPRGHVALEGTRALGHALAGRPVDALRVAAGVRGIAEKENVAMLGQELRTAEALSHRDLGDSGRAKVELEAIAHETGEPLLYCCVLARLGLTEASLDDHDVAQAARWFSDAEGIIENESFGIDGRQWLARVGTRLALAVGDLSSAASWASQLSDAFWAAASAARIHLARADRDAASVALEAAYPRCPRHEVVLALLRSQTADDRDESLKRAAAALECAAANGLLQTVASEGHDLAGLLEGVAWRVPQAWMDRLRSTTAGRGDLPRPGHLDDWSKTDRDPLTDRERDVLRFLPSRLTIAEIAEELYISVNTLKFHLKVIYRKLGVRSRGEAAEAARRMRLNPNRGQTT